MIRKLCSLSLVYIMNTCSISSFYFVCCNRNTNTCSTNNNSSIVFFCCYSFCYFDCCISIDRIIAS